MLLYKIKKLSIEEILVLIVFFDLIFGGSGRVLTLGSISFRIILLIAIILFIFILLWHNKICLNVLNKVLLFFLFYCILNVIVSFAINNKSFIIDEFNGYLTIATSPFFIWFFRKHPKDFKLCINILGSFLFVFAIFSISVWFYCLIKGISSYVIIEPLLNKYFYGSLSYIGNVPRLFLKSSIFLTIGLLLTTRDCLQKKTKLNLFKFIIYVFAIIITFTTSFYVFTLFVLFLYLKEKKVFKNMKYLIIISLITIIAITIVVKMGVLNVMISRFDGEYTMNNKMMQATQLLEKSLKSPLIGYGFGYTMNIDYGYSYSLNVYKFEVMWLQLLLHTGLIGLILFAYHIYKSIQKLNRLYVNYKNDDFIILKLGIIYICLVSFTNPFMNNSIGLTYYAICTGVACMNDNSKKMR